jgi:hypothetical protein
MRAVDARVGAEPGQFVIRRAPAGVQLDVGDLARMHRAEPDLAGGHVVHDLDAHVAEGRAHAGRQVLVDLPGGVAPQPGDLRPDGGLVGDDRQAGLGVLVARVLAEHPAPDVALVEADHPEDRVEDVGDALVEPAVFLQALREVVERVVLVAVGRVLVQRPVEVVPGLPVREVAEVLPVERHVIDEGVLAVRGERGGPSGRESRGECHADSIEEIGHVGRRRVAVMAGAPGSQVGFGAGRGSGSGPVVAEGVGAPGGVARAAEPVHVGARIS